MKSARDWIDDSLHLNQNDPDDQVFIDAAVKMRNDAATSVSRKAEKRICAEIVYKGLRHEVWLTRQRIYLKTHWRKAPYKNLAGFLKRKCLGL